MASAGGFCYDSVSPGRPSPACSCETREVTAVDRGAPSEMLYPHAGFMHLLCNRSGMMAGDVVVAADIDLHLAQETAMIP